MRENKPLFRKVHIWHHPRIPVKFVTYPLVSYGTAKFFDQVSTELNDYSTIFSDNIIWKRGKSAPSNLQFMFKYKSISKPSNGKVIDSLKKNQVMQQSFLSITNWKRRFTSISQIIINKFITHPGVRRYIRRKLYFRDFKRKKVDNFRPLYNLLFKGKIRSHICDEILKYHNFFVFKPSPVKAAIVCDAPQMLLVLRLLKNLGYKSELKHRIRAF